MSAGEVGAQFPAQQRGVGAADEYGIFCIEHLMDKDFPFGDNLYLVEEQYADAAAFYLPQ